MTKSDFTQYAVIAVLMAIVITIVLLNIKVKNYPDDVDDAW